MPMGQDTAKSTVHGEDWSDCMDMQVDEHLHLSFHLTLIGFMYSIVIIMIIIMSSNSSQRQQK